MKSDIVRSRSLAAYQDVDVHSYDNLESFLSSEPQGGLHTIEVGEFNLDVLYEGDYLDSDFLLVFFTAAITAKDTLPFFSGRSVARKLGVPLLAISDPCLALSTRLGAHYYMGSANFDLPAMITRIVRKYGVRRRIIFLGASGAGFPALLHGSRIPNSLSFVMNPVTSILLRPSFIINGKRLHFNEISPRTLIKQRDVVIANANNHVLYVQNVGDQQYLSEQMVPYFMRNIGNKKAYVKFGYWGEGHYAMPADQIIQTLSQLMKTNSWAEGLAEVGKKFSSMDQMLAYRADHWEDVRPS